MHSVRESLNGKSNETKASKSRTEQGPQACADRQRYLSEGANFSITRLTTLKSLCKDPEVTPFFDDQDDL
jgi:hypothetical protein